MSDSSIPAYADTRKIFLQQGNIHGKLSLDRLPRFSEMLANMAGSVTLNVNFTLNDAKERLITGSVSADVQVYCQRCLKPLAITLSDDIKLALVRDEEAAERLDEDLDPWICEDFKLDLAELAEEQLILCTPLVSYHDDGECIERKNFVAGASTESEVTAAEAQESPFAVLKSLKDSGPSN